MEKPLAADMDQDGIDDIGLWNPSSSTAPPGTAEWHVFVSGARLRVSVRLWIHRSSLRPA